MTTAVARARPLASRSRRSALDEAIGRLPTRGAATPGRRRLDAGVRRGSPPCRPYRCPRIARASSVPTSTTPADPAALPHLDEFGSTVRDLCSATAPTPSGRLVRRRPARQFAARATRSAAALRCTGGWLSSRRERLVATHGHIGARPLRRRLTAATDEPSAGSARGAFRAARSRPTAARRPHPLVGACNTTSGPRRAGRYAATPCSTTSGRRPRGLLETAWGRHAVATPRSARRRDRLTGGSPGSCASSRDRRHRASAR